MPVSVYNTAIYLGTEGARGRSSVYNLGMSAGTQKAATLRLFSLTTQVMQSIRSGMALQSIAAQVCFRADQDPVTGGYANPATMNIEDEDMIFTDVIFPPCITYGSTGVPKYLTDKAEVLSGNEQRETRYQYPRHEYAINMENLPANEAAEVLNIWHICSGDFAGFLFLDPQDHTSNNSATLISGSVISPSDQLVGSAIGSVAEYPLYKYYTHGNSGRQKQRRIGYPKVDTLQVAVAGEEIFSWEYDLTLRVLRFTRPQSLRSAEVTKVGDVLTSAASVFNNLEVGDLIFIDGFAQASTNVLSGNPHRVAGKADDREIRIERFSGVSLSTTDDEADVTVSFQSALPPTGAAITAGFYFYVPVRFDDGDNANSEIIAGLRESAITTFSDIKLREVFE